MVLRAKPEKVEERERTRLALLRATLVLAGKHGFAGLGLREVSRGAEIAPTSFYRHFSDMSELGIALVQELVMPLLRDWLEHTEAKLPGADKPERVLVEQALVAARADRDLMRFVLAERVGAQPSCRQALRGALDTWAVGLHDALSTHASRELPPHVAEAALTLLLDALSAALEAEGAEQAAMQKVEAQLAYLLSTPLWRAPKRP